ncbi:MAG TPA: hypothetical protein P5186_03000 [Candidatus Paceibacterota bacterium]|nr:hypothetical protein [Candidatus Paceibacterota bacterium]
MTVVTVPPEEMPPGGIEQMQRDLAEVDLLRQKNARELVEVSDKEVNGHPLSRTFVYQYRLADGRIHTSREGGAEPPGPSAEDEAQIAVLRNESRREVIHVLDTEFNSFLQRMLTCRYHLSDGRIVTVEGDADPALVGNAAWLSEDQSRELWRLVGLKQGESLGKTDTFIYGTTFTFERNRYQLSDGTVVVLADGQPKGQKTTLTGSDWEEYRALVKSGLGVSGGEREEEIGGRMFTFRQERYVLSDGTEVVRSTGRPCPEAIR